MKQSVQLFTTLSLLLLINSLCAQDINWAPKTITEVETQLYTPYFSESQQFKASMIITATSPSTSKRFLFILRFYPEGAVQGSNIAEEQPNQFFVLRNLNFKEFENYYDRLHNRRKRRVRMRYYKKGESDFFSVISTRNKRTEDIYEHQN